jgi:hypothetical protein
MFRAVQQARRRDAARLRMPQHARACINAAKQCGRTTYSVSCVATRFTAHATGGPSRGRRATRGSSCSPPSVLICHAVSDGEGARPAPQAQTPPAKLAAAHPRAAPAAEGARAAEEDGAAGAEAERAERDAAWAARLAAALDINTALEGALAELRAQNARLRRCARGPQRGPLVLHPMRCEARACGCGLPSSNLSSTPRHQFPTLLDTLDL